MKIPLLAVPHSGLWYSPLSLPEPGKGSAQSPSSCYVSLNQAYKLAGVKKFSTRPKNIFECERQLENFYRGEILKNPKLGKPYLDFGNYYLTRKGYISATVYFESGLHVDRSNVRILEQLGKAHFGLKNYEKAREAYGVALRLESRNTTLLQLHVEASIAYLKDNTHKLNTEQVGQIDHEIDADHALSLALRINTEKKNLKELESTLHQLRHASKDQASQVLSYGMQTALLYLQLSEIKFPKPQDSALVQKELKSLALDFFAILSKKANLSPHSEIKNLGILFSGYIPYIQGDFASAREKFSKIPQDPEAQKLLKLMQNGPLRAKNLAALEIWEAYLKDGTRIQTDKAKSLFFTAIVDPVEKRRGNQTFEEKVMAGWNLKHEVFLKVKALLLNGTAASIQEALEITSKDESEAVRDQSISLLKNSHLPHSASGNILSNLIGFVSKEIPDARPTEVLLDSAIELERHYGPLSTVLGVCGLIKSIGLDEASRIKATELINKIKKGKGVVDHLTDAVLTTTLEDLATDLVILHGAWKASNFFKKWTTILLKNKLGLTHIAWVVLARSVAVWSEVGVIWGGTLLREALQYDPSKVFESKRMLERFLYLSLSVRGIKTMGAIGNAFSPGWAKKLNMYNREGTDLTARGKFFSWMILHTFALSGIMGVDLGLQWLGRREKPGIWGVDWIIDKAGYFPSLPGGYQESIAKNFVMYLKYAFAARTFAKIFNPNYHAAHLKSFKTVSRLEAESSAENGLLKLDYVRAGKDKSGQPYFGFEKFTRLDKKTFNRIVKFQFGKNKPVLPESVPWVQEFYHQIVHYQLVRPGFSSGKMMKHLIAKDMNAAEAYLRQFSIKLETGKNGELSLRELTLHDKIGISTTAPASTPKAEAPLPTKKIRKDNRPPTLSP